MSNSEIRIDILGTSITISADADPNYLKSLLEQYQQSVNSTQRLTGLTDPLKIAVLTGFLLCDEMEKSKIKEQPPREEYDFIDSQEAEKLTLDMITRIDKALGRDNHE